MNTLIDRIKMIIEAKKCSPRAFAKAIEFNYATLSNYLSGRRTTLDSELIIRILATYDNLSADWLLRGKGNMFNQEEEPECELDKLKNIVYTIDDLQDQIIKKTLQTQHLLEENQKLKDELTRLTNERNII